METRARKTEVEIDFYLSEVLTFLGKASTFKQTIQLIVTVADGKVVKIEDRDTSASLSEQYLHFLRHWSIHEDVKLVSEEIKREFFLEINEKILEQCIEPATYVLEITEGVATHYYVAEESGRAYKILIDLVEDLMARSYDESFKTAVINEAIEVICENLPK